MINYDNPVPINKKRRAKFNSTPESEQVYEPESEPETNSESMMEDKAEKREDLIALFTQMTSSLYVLGVKIKGFHWNIVGDQFFPLHKCLDKQVDALFDFADEAAEVIRQLDINAPAPVNMADMVSQSFIEETSTTSLVKAEEFLPIIVNDYKTVRKECCSLMKVADAAGRQDLSDFAIAVRKHVDKFKWQFESSIK